MAKFKIGDRVKCTNASPVRFGFNAPPLVLGREYIIYKIHFCSTCGMENLDVGLISKNGNPSYCRCLTMIENSNTYFAASYRFEKAIEKVEYIAVTTNIEIQEPTLN